MMKLVYSRLCVGVGSTSKLMGYPVSQVNVYFISLSFCSRSRSILLCVELRIKGRTVMSCLISYLPVSGVLLGLYVEEVCVFLRLHTDTRQ